MFIAGNGVMWYHLQSSDLYTFRNLTARDLYVKWVSRLNFPRTFTSCDQNNNTLLPLNVAVFWRVLTYTAILLSGKLSGKLQDIWLRHQSRFPAIFSAGNQSNVSLRHVTYRTMMFPSYIWREWNFACPRFPQFSIIYFIHYRCFSVNVAEILLRYSVTLC